MNDNHFLLTNLLSEDEVRVITSIAEHIEKGEKRVGIQQIAMENYLSTTFIMKMCKRLGFDGYSDLYYHLSHQLTSRETESSSSELCALIDNFSDELVEQFCHLLHDSRNQKMFTTGHGFSAITVSYIVQRLNVCGFMVFNNVPFYDIMLSQSAYENEPAHAGPPIMFAVSQSGEASPVINDVRHARQQGYKVVSFTKRSGSTLAKLSDIAFIIDGSKQTLVGSLPNPFFGHVILAFEELMGNYFSRFSTTQEP